MKLDRLVGKHGRIGRTAARRVIVAGRVRVDGRVEVGISQEVDRFARVELDGECVREGGRRIHVMMHKPAGVVSATRDAEHVTVVDLIDDPDRDELHLVGRLDRSTTGLVLLTNDGNWSKRLMAPEKKVAKVYLVETRDVIPVGAVEEFARGFYFHTEDLTTAPAELELLGERRARLTLHEGRYHQVKRMFHRIGNRVVALHRERVGEIVLPAELAPGGWRYLTKEEVEA
ncbi:MAG: 16S rRNA pseudouridine(516) synthase [Verrucomicrobiales bacterium]|nr:pseudouridine synthase [Verrucomicrobiota bacterium JB025]